MAQPRFHVDQPLAPGGRLALPDQINHHALRVLRMREGDELILFDGRGGEYPATLEIAGRQGLALLGAHNPREAELPGRITLVQAIPASDKMDWVVEKAVEVGVAAIQPVAAARSVLRLAGERLEKRVAHWQRVAIAACEQCGRNRVPPVATPLGLEQWLARAAPAGCLRVLCDPDAEPRLGDWLAGQATPPMDIELMVGPEGGWAPEEWALAERHGVQRVRFGERVLRTETAGTALITAVSAKLGWV